MFKFLKKSKEDIPLPPPGMKPLQEPLSIKISQVPETGPVPAPPQLPPFPPAPGQPILQEQPVPISPPEHIDIIIPQDQPVPPSPEPVTPNLPTVPAPPVPPAKPAPEAASLPLAYQDDSLEDFTLPDFDDIEEPVAEESGATSLPSFKEIPILQKKMHIFVRAFDYIRLMNERKKIAGIVGAAYRDTEELARVYSQENELFDQWYASLNACQEKLIQIDSNLFEKVKA